MPTELAGTTALVTGASRGFGAAIAAALAAAGAHVVGVSRDAHRLEELGRQLGDGFTPVTADVTDPMVAGSLIDRHHPQTLVLNAGASPLARPLQQHTWQSFSRTWDVDVKHAFYWTREALLRPLDPGSVVIAMSSAAATSGSPLTGGYSAAKAAIRFVADFAQGESQNSTLGIRFVSVLPTMTRATELGLAAAAAYARQRGTDVDAFMAPMGPELTLDQVGRAVVGLATDQQRRGAYRLSGSGLEPLR